METVRVYKILHVYYARVFRDRHSDHEFTARFYEVSLYKHDQRNGNEMGMSTYMTFNSFNVCTKDVIANF